MDEHFVFMRLVEEPTRRRSWLLYRALECLPLDRAIDLAQTADEFITGAPSERHYNASVRSEPAVASPSRRRGQQRPPAEDTVSTAEAAPALRPSAPALPTEVRHQLIDRLATGAKNAEVAREFGLTPKQVQGVRMGCTKEIAKRRDKRENEEPTLQSPAVVAAVDDVVRYLRQQDDVVVRQENGEFLVNARFRLPLTELVSRANRMRKRQGKAEFDVGGGQPARAGTNGHPLFWSENAPTQFDSEPGSSI